MFIWFFYFIDVIYYTYWFVCIEPFLNLRDKSHWSQCTILLMYCYIWFVDFENFCTYILNRHWFIILYSCAVFIWIWCKSHAGFVEWLWKYLRRISVNYSFKRFVEFSSEAIWSWSFLRKEIFDSWLNLFTCYWFVPISISSWFSHGSLCFFFGNVSIF